MGKAQAVPQPEDGRGHRAAIAAHRISCVSVSWEFFCEIFGDSVLATPATKHLPPQPGEVDCRFASGPTSIFLQFVCVVYLFSRAPASFCCFAHVSQLGHVSVLCASLSLAQQAFTLVQGKRSSASEALMVVCVLSHQPPRFFCT